MSIPLRLAHGVRGVLSMLCREELSAGFVRDTHEILANFYLASKCQLADLETVCVYACAVLLRLHQGSNAITPSTATKLFLTAVMLSATILFDLEVPIDAWPVLSARISAQKLTDMILWFLVNIRWNLHIDSVSYHSMSQLLNDIMDTVEVE